MRSNDMTRGARTPEFDPTEVDPDNRPWTADMLERAQWGRRIRLFRIENQLTHEELALHANVTVNQVIDWEKGRTLITVDEFEQLCRPRSEGLTR